jgi:hypothetical protein
MRQIINMTSMRELQGDDPDGSVHVCRPVQVLCRPDCTNTTGQDMFISESKNEMVSSSPGVQTIESAYTSAEHMMNPLYIPEKNAHTPYMCYIYQYFYETRDNLSIFLCIHVCTPAAHVCNECTRIRP